MRLVGCGYVDKPLSPRRHSTPKHSGEAPGAKTLVLFLREHFVVVLAFFPVTRNHVASTRCLVAEAVLSSPAYFC
jgi:hypothetical protein